MASPEHDPKIIDKDALLLPTRVDRPPLDPSVWDMYSPVAPSGDGLPPTQAISTPGPSAPKRRVAVGVDSASSIYDGAGDFVPQRSPVGTRHQAVDRSAMKQSLLAEIRAEQRRKVLKVGGYGVALTVLVSLTAAGVMVVRDRSTASSEPSPTLTPLVQESTTTLTTLEAPTTTTIESLTCTEYIVVKGDNLTTIAEKLTAICSRAVTVSQLMLYNNISDADVIAEGQRLIFTGPIPTTTLAPTTTVPVTEAPTTLAPTTVAPAPETTQPPATTAPAKPNDGVLKDPECAALGGVRHSFNETFTQFAKVAYAPITDHEVFNLYNKIMVQFHIENIYGDTPGDAYDLAECVPKDRATAFKIING